jgi:hypothetical protein
MELRLLSGGANSVKLRGGWRSNPLGIKDKVMDKVEDEVAASASEPE